MIGWLAACAADSSGGGVRPSPAPEVAPGSGASGASGAPGGGGASGGAAPVGTGLPADTHCTIDGCVGGQLPGGQGGGTQAGGKAQGGQAQGGSAQGGSAQGGTAQGGSAQGGSGGPPPGTLGGPCLSGKCSAELTCSTTNVCQPETTALTPFIVQTVPPPDTAGVPTLSPIVLFVKGGTAPLAINVKLFTPTGSPDVTTDFSVDSSLSTATGTQIYVLAPKHALPPSAVLIVRATDGEGLATLVYSLATAPTPSPTAVTRHAFDDPTPQLVPLNGAPLVPALRRLPVGWSSIGDVAVVADAAITQEGAPLLPTSAPAFVGLSTGSAYPPLKTGALGGLAAGNTSSLLQSGPLPIRDLMTFNYVLQSEEIPTYCDGQYDDTFLVVVSGPDGVRAQVADSVNRVCDASMGVYPDVDLKSFTMKQMDGTGRKLGALPTTAVGSPAVVTFIVTDVADTGIDTLVAIDDVEFSYVE